MCADIEILSGKIEDCSGQCTNGATCMNGECQCRKGFSGTFCEIVEYTPQSTNYTLYLKYFLFFIVMVLIIIGLLFGAYLMFKNADKIRERAAAMMPKREARPVVVQDEDALGGAAVGQGQSHFGNNMDLINN